MRKLLVIALAILLHASALADQTKPDIADIGWLQGCWRSQANGRDVEEHWMRPAGQTMLAMSRTVKNGKTVAYEFLQIRQDDSGEIYFVAKPSGQAEAAFKLVKRGDREVVFENPEHDFPQRIIYRLQPDGSLVARIEGTESGTERGIDFPMKRVDCE